MATFFGSQQLPRNLRKVSKQQRVTACDVCPTLRNITRTGRLLQKGEHPGGVHFNVQFFQEFRARRATRGNPG